MWHVGTEAPNRCEGGVLWQCLSHQLWQWHVVRVTGNHCACTMLPGFIFSHAAHVTHTMSHQDSHDHYKWTLFVWAMPPAILDRSGSNKYLTYVGWWRAKVLPPGLQYFQIFPVILNQTGQWSYFNLWMEIQFKQEPNCKIAHQPPASEGVQLSPRLKSWIPVQPWTGHEKKRHPFCKPSQLVPNWAKLWSHLLPPSAVHIVTSCTSFPTPKTNSNWILMYPGMFVYSTRQTNQNPFLFFFGANTITIQPTKCRG